MLSGSRGCVSEALKPLFWLSGAALRLCLQTAMPTTLLTPRGSSSGPVLPGAGGLVLLPCSAPGKREAPQPAPGVPCSSPRGQPGPAGSLPAPAGPRRPHGGEGPRGAPGQQRAPKHRPGLAWPLLARPRRPAPGPLPGFVLPPNPASLRRAGTERRTRG